MCQHKSFENTVGKGEIARNEQFLLFPQCFLTAFGELSAIFVKFGVVVCKLFPVWKSLKFVVRGRVKVTKAPKNKQVKVHLDDFLS